MCCLLLTVINVTVVAISPQVVGRILIVEGNNDLLDVQPTVNQIVGQPLILHCSVNPNVGLKNYTWTTINRTTSTTLRVKDEVEQSNDYLVIPQLNTSNDGQVYLCQVQVAYRLERLTARGLFILNLTGK